MADRVDYYFRQRVTEAELDLAFELLEQADRDLAADVGIYGIVSGAVPAQHSPVPDLSVDLTSPTRAYDRLGQRIFVGTDQTVDCSVDLVGIPTAVATAGNERWLAVFLRFERQLSDPRTDGNAQQVFFRRDESFEVVVRQAPEAAIGTASQVALQQDELLVCDIRLVQGQTQILDADIDTLRRQAFIFAQGNAVAVEAGTWTTLQPLVETVQASLDEVDAELTDHFGGTARRHPAAAIDFAPHAFLTSITVQDALVELLDALISTTAGDAGAERIGADAVSGTPHALGPSTVDNQLSQLLGWLNTHVGALTGAHNASAIAAQAHAYISGPSVQAQLQEIVSDLQSQAAGEGASQVGHQAAAGAPTSLAGGDVQAALETLLTAINARALKAGETFTGNLLPSPSGLNLGSAAARWDAFLRDVTATASGAGTPALHAFAPDAATPAIRAAGGLLFVEGDAIEASHDSFIIVPIKVWDLVKGWSFLPQHRGDVPDAVEIDGVTQRNLVKGWGNVSAAGVLSAPHWNIASVSKPGTGQYLITLDIAPGAVNAVVATVSSGAITADFSIHVFSPSGISFEVDINSGGTPSDQAFTFVVLGA